MQRAFLVTLSLIAVIGCGDDDATTPRANDRSDRSDRTPRASDRATPREALEADPHNLPLGWWWVTETTEGYIVAFPGLPVPVPAADGSRPLTHSRPPDTFAVRLVNQPLDTVLEPVRASLGEDAELLTWHEGRQLRSSAGTIGLWPTDNGTFIIEGMSAVDADAFVNSFAAIDGPEANVYTLGEDGPRVSSPTRLGAMVDTGIGPPIIGFRGLLGGIQMVATHAELPGVVVPAQTLEASAGRMVSDMDGTVLTTDLNDHSGKPSRRFTFRAGNGMHATVRLSLKGRRLYHVAAYAHSGTEPAWAPAYVDSLAF